MVAIGGTELIRFSRRNQSVETEFNPESKFLSPQLTRQKDLTRICKELTEGFAMNWMQGNAENNREKKRHLDEVFFERGTSMHETNARAQRNYI